MRHDPAWLRLHDGHAHGVLADDPVHAHSGSEPSAGHTDQQNHHRPHSDAAQSHVDPARTDTSGSASLTRPNHPKAALPIDQRVGPAGSCTGGFRTQAPETLHRIRRSSPRGVCRLTPKAVGWATRQRWVAMRLFADIHRSRSTAGRRGESPAPKPADVRQLPRLSVCLGQHLRIGEREEREHRASACF